MSTAPAETDLLVPLPAEGETWDPHTIHTHYFGFCVPEARIGGFSYIRYQPAFPLSQGGVLVYQGLDNNALADMAFIDYQMTMPWPEVDGATFTTANGLSYDFVEPGSRARITYASTDGRLEIDLDATAASPLAARGHVVPGEELYKGLEPGGSEQFMHLTGTLTLDGERYAVDCHYPRDRSWRQVRTESRDTPYASAPICWTPVYFDEDLAFNQVGAEAPAGHHFGWVSRKGEIRGLESVQRRVTRAHPQLFAPLAMEIDAEDDTGETYALTGEAIALAPLAAWPNVAAFESLMRWEDGEGRVGYGPAQSVWGQPAAHAFKNSA